MADKFQLQQNSLKIQQLGYTRSVYITLELWLVFPFLTVFVNIIVLGQWSFKYHLQPAICTVNCITNFKTNI